MTKQRPMTTGQKQYRIRKLLAQAFDLAEPTDEIENEIERLCDELDDGEYGRSSMKFRVALADWSSHRGPWAHRHQEKSSN